MVWPFGNSKAIDPLWLKIAMGELGVKEIPGKKHNPRVLEYQKCCTLMASDDETAWCSSFVNWCMDLAGEPGTHKANAKSWAKWGGQCIPSRGAITVLWRVHPSSWKGHVGFFIKQNDKYIWLLGGNQANKVCIRKYPINRVLCHRWPEEVNGL